MKWRLRMNDDKTNNACEEASKTQNSISVTVWVSRHSKYVTVLGSSQVLFLGGSWGENGFHATCCACGTVSLGYNRKLKIIKINWFKIYPTLMFNFSYAFKRDINLLCIGFYIVSLYNHNACFSYYYFVLC